MIVYFEEFYVSYENDKIQTWSKNLSFQLLWGNFKTLNSEHQNDLFREDQYHKIVEYLKDRFHNITVEKFDYGGFPEPMYIIGIKSLNFVEDDDYMTLLTYDGIEID